MNNILDKRVQLTEGFEPTLRMLIHGYYMQNIDDKKKAKEYAERYCKIIEEKSIDT